MKLAYSASSRMRGLMPTTSAPAGWCAMLDLIGTTATVSGTCVAAPKLTGGQARDVVRDLRLFGAQRLGQRPARRVRRQIDELRAGGLGVDAGAAHQPQASSVGVQ